MRYDMRKCASAVLLCFAVTAANTYAQEDLIYSGTPATTTAAAPAATTTAAPTSALATTAPAQTYTQQQLDELLAPIALYPDALLSQILMASTYPLEVVEAARWSKANPGLQGDAAVQAVVNQGWDPSVKSLTAFPQVLTTMDDKLDWTEQLGEAFLAQQADVMSTVQSLRAKAYAAGNLQSGSQQQVTQDGQTIIVTPYSPDTVYVPYYDPRVVYGSWWWSTPPVYWAPFPTYYAPVSAGVVWGSGISVSLGFFFGAVDWTHRHVTVVHTDNYYYRPSPMRPGRPGVPPPVIRPGAWQHDASHRLEYHNETVRRRYESPLTPVMHTQQHTQPSSTMRSRPQGGSPTLRPAPSAPSGNSGMHMEQRAPQGGGGGGGERHGGGGDRH